MKKIISVFLPVLLVLFCISCTNSEIEWTYNDNNDQILYSEEIRLGVSEKADELGQRIITEWLAAGSALNKDDLEVCVDSFTSYTAEDSSSFAMKSYRVNQANLSFLTEIYFLENGSQCKIADFCDYERFRPLIRGDDILYFVYDNSIKLIDSHGKMQTLVPIMYGTDDERFFDIQVSECSDDDNILTISYELYLTTSLDLEQKNVIYHINCRTLSASEPSVETNVALS